MSSRPPASPSLLAVAATVALTAALGACEGGAVVGAAAPATAALTCNDVDTSGGCVGGPTYATVQPILEKACIPCHFDTPDPKAPWPLTEYADLVSWESVLKEDLLGCAMPPIDSAYPFTEQDRQVLVRWLLCKAPR